jgi:predicted AAA+ superfamily ATPase
MDVKKLYNFNEWWVTGKVKPSLLKTRKRPLFFELQKYMKDRQILLITGLRRVGKTTLIYQLIQDLLDKNVKSSNILYFSFDEESWDLDEIIEVYEEKVLKKKIDEEKVYIFLDEIQKCKNWQNKIKILYDLHPNMKILISGSASVQINKKAKESLAGRMFDFVLEPLSFKEFLEWKGFKVDEKKIELSSSWILPLFQDYLRKGGFPEIVDEEDDEKIKRYIKNSIIEKIVYTDLPEEFGIKDYELLKTLIEMVATQPGITINYDKISRDLKRNKKTIIDYIFYLEYSFLIKLVSNFRGSFISSSRKLKKAYIANTAISFALEPDFYSNSFLEKIAENFAVIDVDTKNYYKNKYEVDIVLKRGKEVLPIEVKYGRVEVDSIINFLSEFKLKRGIILTKDVFERKRINKKEVLIMPLWAFSLMKEKWINSKSSHS